MRTTTWLKCCALAGALAAGTAPAAEAQDIFKCVEGGATAYQSTPCANGQIELPMTRGVAASGVPHPRVDGQTSEPVPLPAGPPLRIGGPWRLTTLRLGMSDDEVLNLPGWGRPGRVTRVRMPRVWREEWIYGQSMTGERHLYFANARLVDVIDKPPVDQVARLTPQ
jgi:hypothetical protein